MPGIGYRKIVRLLEHSQLHALLGSCSLAGGGDLLAPRIRVCFQAEDPFVFAKRVAAAQRSRQHAEQLMRYQLAIESMPSEDVLVPSVEQVNRVLDFALNSKMLKVSNLTWPALHHAGLTKCSSPQAASCSSQAGLAVLSGFSCCIALAFMLLPAADKGCHLIEILVLCRTSFWTPPS